MHPLPEARIHSGSQRYDAVLAVFLANLIHGGEGPAPVLGARLIDEAGLPFGGLERLRVDSQQTDGFRAAAFADLRIEPAARVEALRFSRQRQAPFAEVIFEERFVQRRQIAYFA